MTEHIRSIAGLTTLMGTGRASSWAQITQPALAFEYLQVLLRDYEHEVFSAVFLDSQHRVNRLEELFRGSIDSASVYPLEVVKQALACNAAAVILVHNHASGDADRRITQRLKETLGLVEVRVIDHIVVGSEGCESSAELSNGTHDAITTGGQALALARMHANVENVCIECDGRL